MSNMGMTSMKSLCGMAGCQIKCFRWKEEQTSASGNQIDLNASERLKSPEGKDTGGARCHSY